MELILGLINFSNSISFNTMFKKDKIFSGFSIDDSIKAKQFYSEVLGLDIEYVKGMEQHGVLELRIPGCNNILLY